MQAASLGVGAMGAGVVPRTFAWSGEAQGERMRWFAAGLRSAMLDQGYTEMAAPGPEVAGGPPLPRPRGARPYRRKAAPTFVVALAELPEAPVDLLRTGYPLLVRGLANLCIMVSPAPAGSIANFVTLEQGTYSQDTSLGSDADFFKTVFARVEPLATSRLVIGNDFVPDLPPELWEGDEITRQITRAGERLDALDLLPAAFPIEEILSERDLRHVKLLYGIGGLSYGNVSARRPVDPESPSRSTG
jgi:hypothetical protein